PGRRGGLAATALLVAERAGPGLRAVAAAVRAAGAAGPARQGSAPAPDRDHAGDRGGLADLVGAVHPDPAADRLLRHRGTPVGVRRRLPAGAHAAAAGSGHRCPPPGGGACASAAHPAGPAGLDRDHRPAGVRDGSLQFPGWIAMWPLVAAGAVVVAGHSGRVWGVDRLLSTRPAAFIGDISYALYLVHWPILVIWLHTSSQERAGLWDGLAV